jgi:hypothetical protein
MMRSFRTKVDDHIGRRRLVRTLQPCPAEQARSKRKLRILTVYVIEIGGRGVAAFHAWNGSDAEVRAQDRTVRDDLMALTNAGQPLWDGVVGFRVRQALAAEDATWRASRAKAIRQGNIEGDDDTWIAFLVALNDPDRRKRRSSALGRS